MAKLCEILKKGIQSKVKRAGTVKLEWTGYEVADPRTGRRCEANDIILLSDDWEIDEPTAWRILEERGWKAVHNSQTGLELWTDKMNRRSGPLSHRLFIDMPKTAAEMTRIIDFLESLS